MAMRKSSCKNTPQYLRSCCSPIGQNNTKDFSVQSGGSIGRAVWKWSCKSRFPGAFSALLVNMRRFISFPDLFPVAPANRPWVSEDAVTCAPPAQRSSIENKLGLSYNFFFFFFFKFFNFFLFKFVYYPTGFVCSNRLH